MNASIKPIGAFYNFLFSKVVFYNFIFSKGTLCNFTFLGTFYYFAFLGAFYNFTLFKGAFYNSVFPKFIIRLFFLFACFAASYAPPEVWLI